MTGQHVSGHTRLKLLQDFITDLPFPAGYNTTDTIAVKSGLKPQKRLFNFDLICIKIVYCLPTLSLYIRIFSTWAQSPWITYLLKIS